MSAHEFNSHGRPTWAAIDLDALTHNYAEVRRALGAKSEVMAVVKADAYGHGAVKCARALSAAGARWFCVAIPEEAAELRAAGLRNERLLCLGGVWGEQAAWCVAERVAIVVYRFDMAQSVNRAAAEQGVIADVHIEIDTGMNRLGVRYDEAAEFARRLAELPNLRVEAVMTHFAAADEPAREDFTRKQIKRFDRAVEAVRAAGHQPLLFDLANSAGTFAYPEAQGNMVRPGGVLYGLWRDVLAPVALESRMPELRRVMNLHTRITLLKEVPTGDTLGYGCTFRVKRPSLIATLPIGYNDGYPRALSNNGRVILHNRYAPIVGRVSMDLTLIDATDIARETAIAENDFVTLIGAQATAEITAEELAAQVNTISYEITCGLSRRVPRRTVTGDR